MMLAITDPDQKRRNSKALIADLTSMGHSTGPKKAGQEEMQAKHIKYLLQDYEFFQKLAPEVREQLPSIIQLVPGRKKGEVLFFEGAKPDNAYILLSGIVGVYKHLQQEQHNAADDEKEKTVSEDSTSCPASARSFASSSDGQPQQQQPRRRPPSQGAFSMTKVQEPSHDWGTSLGKLEEGALFGELALLNDTVRSATIVCEEDCDFLAIERADFEAVLKAGLARAREDKLNLLREHLPGFRSLPEHKMNKVFYRFQYQKFPKGHMFAIGGNWAKSQAFLLVDGLVEARVGPKHIGIAGKRDNRVLSTIMPGGLFGSMHHDQKEAFTVVAKTECNVLSVSELSIKRLPLTISHRMDKYLGNANLSRARRHSIGSSTSLPVDISDCEDHCLPQIKQKPLQRCGSQPSYSPSSTKMSFMTKRAAAAAQQRMHRSSSATVLASPTASKERTALVNSGFLQVTDLLHDIKLKETRRRSVGPMGIGSSLDRPPTTQSYLSSSTCGMF